MKTPESTPFCNQNKEKKRKKEERKKKDAHYIIIVNDFLGWNFGLLGFLDFAFSYPAKPILVAVLFALSAGNCVFNNTML